MTIRKLLLRVPILGHYFERRWTPDPVERDLHREVVRERLAAPAIPEAQAEVDEPRQPTGP